MAHSIRLVKQKNCGGAMRTPSMAPKIKLNSKPDHQRLLAMLSSTIKWYRGNTQSCLSTLAMLTTSSLSSSLSQVSRHKSRGPDYPVKAPGQPHAPSYHLYRARSHTNSLDKSILAYRNRTPPRSQRSTPRPSHIADGQPLLLCPPMRITST